MLESARNKMERHAHSLQMHRGTHLAKDDRFWLSITAQKLHVNHKYDEPLDEGSFEIIKKIGYETFKVLLGKGICATLTSANLVPCFKKLGLDEKFVSRGGV